ncbi:MAG: HU family DNA-binding protein [Planctomycetota bacterium]
MSETPQTITKKELVNRISEQTGLTKVVVKDVLQRFLDEIIEELARGNRLEFREFGVFEVRERAARRAQNPRTLEKVDVPSKRVVKYKVGRLMRERVCDERPEEAARRIRSERAKSPSPAKVAHVAPPVPPPSRPNSPF